MTMLRANGTAHKTSNANPIDTDGLIRAVNEMMLRATKSEVSTLEDASHHIIEAGGKRIRPRMLLLTYTALGGEELDQALPVAASIEMVHTASVVHDDINDHGLVRRGRASVNAKWGRTFALLTGDFLFTKVYQLMAPYSQEINAAFADATVALVEGETLQAKAVKEQTFTRQVYFEVIGLKTAELFRAATKLGAILAGADAKTVEAMGNYGYDVGMAFQIVDDILDLVGDEATLGKTSGIDAEQGRGLSQISPDDGDPMAIIKQKVMNRDTIDEGRMMAQRFVDNALEGLEVLGDSPAKQALQEIAYTVIDRDH